MYTLIVNNDHTVIASETTTIMQRSKLVDNLQILVPQTYNDIDLTDSVVKMEYISPSKEYKIQMLTLNNPHYKENFLQYVVKGDTDITAESGYVEFHLVFFMLQQNEEGEILQRVRETQPFKIYITPSAAWSLQIPDDVLEPLNQTILAQMALAKQTEAFAEQLYNDSAKDIKIDEISNKIKLLARSGEIGEGIAVDALAKKIADIILAPDLDGTEDGITYLDEIPNSANITNLDELLKK